MALAFEATFVDCGEAIGGELLQVTFDTVPANHDENLRQSPCVIISRLFEFPGRETVDWHDGRDYDGGAEVISGSLRRTGFSARLNRGALDIAFALPDDQFTELVSFLERILGPRIAVHEKIRTGGSSQ